MYMSPKSVLNEKIIMCKAHKVINVVLRQIQH